MKVVGNLKGSTEVLHFDSVKEAAEHIGVFGSSISRCIKIKRYIHGWAFENEDVWDGKPLVYSDPVYVNTKYTNIFGLSPIGGYVRFTDAKEVTKLLGITSEKVRSVLRRNKKTAKGWVFSMEEPKEECVALTKEMIDATVIRRGRKKAGFVVNPPTTAQEDACEEEDMREPIMVGFVESGTIPAICPICHAVLGMGIREHLVKCLKGHDYAIRGGKWIHVYD